MDEFSFSVNADVKTAAKAKFDTGQKKTGIGGIPVKKITQESEEFHLLFDGDRLQKFQDHPINLK